MGNEEKTLSKEVLEMLETIDNETSDEYFANVTTLREIWRMQEIIESILYNLNGAEYYRAIIRK